MDKLIDYRDRAIAWLNSKRDFDAGVALLEESKFKPGVVRKLKNDGVNGQAAKERLYHVMMQLVNAWSMTSEQLNDETDPVTGLPSEGAAITETTRDRSFTEIVLKAENNKMVDPRIRELITRYANAYRQRDKLHRELTSLAEDNDDKTMKQRKQLIGMIDNFTEVMEMCYPAIESYINLGKVVEEQVDKASRKPEEGEAKTVNPTSYDSIGLEELKKMHKNIKIRILRAQNMLDYQQETKREAKDPLPECPKRLRYEQRIQKLKKELEQIEYTIVRRQA